MLQQQQTPPLPPSMVMPAPGLPVLQPSSKSVDPVPLPSPKLRAQLASSHSSSSSSSSSSSLPVSGGGSSAHDAALLSLLRQRRTDEAYQVYACSPHLPGPTCLSRLLAQLSYQKTPSALARACALVRRLRDEGQLHRLDANSLGLLAVAAARSGATTYALAVLRTMLRSGYLPHVKAWSAVVSRLSASPDGGGAAEALRLFDSVVRRVRRVTVATDARPDAAAFNAALNACANLGDVRRFAQLFDEMPQFGAQPDVLTYNVLIKMCARAERKDLLVFALERIITTGIVPCITTLHSLVAAYVGFNELETAEKLVQAMREGRQDLCFILRQSNDGNSIERSDEETHALLEKLVMYRHSTEEDGEASEAPLLPKTYVPDSRIYTTLMKGYMKQDRVEDVVQTIRAMQQEADPASHPDHVTYTTVISALIKVGEMDRARRVLEEMAHAGVRANRVTYNVLLKGYCQQLQLGKAKELVREMSEQAGIEPNVVSYNILIDGCILADDSAGALAYFNEMRERGIAPSNVSYTTLMKAFALSGQPKLAHKVFDEMENDPRVKVDKVAYNMLIEGYCRLGLLEEAKKIVEKMRQNGFEPDVATYGSLANGIALARKPGEALLLWNEVKEKCAASPPLRPDEGLLDALADVCVRAAFFRKALEIVACMEENSISPNKTKYKKIYVEMHSRMFTSKHASQARQDRRRDRKRAAEAFKFWLGLPNSYYGSEWRLEPDDGQGHEAM